MELDVKIVVAIIASLSALVSAYIMHALSRKKEASKSNVEIAKEYASLKYKSPEDAEALANSLGPGLLVYRNGKEKVIIGLPPSGTLIIGSKKGVDILLNDPFVSHQSAMISVNEGIVTIQSLVSNNIITVNGNSISKKNLVGDDCVKIGGTTIYFRSK